jgi:8-oxo-dGTP pyrophosphatase MutT (NUDIX family)
VGGGTDGESDEVAIMRETKEESGYTDIEIIKKIVSIGTFGFRFPKNKNQKTSGNFYHAKLLSEEKVQSEADE